MAYAPDTTTGTITLIEGQTAFTTAGVNMLTRGHQPGDTIIRNGLTLVIAAIGSENAGTLAEACPAGAAGAGVPVRVRFQADGSRVAARAADLVQLLGQSGNLEALGGLGGAADTLPYFTGAGTMALATLGAYGRALLAGTGPLKAAGGASWGTSMIPPEGDWDQVLTGGVYMKSGMANAPDGGSGWWYVLVQQHAAAYCSQIAIALTGSGEIYNRTLNNGTWSPWRTIWNSQNFDPASKANGADVTAALDLKSNVGHGHSTGEITGLDAALGSRVRLTSGNIVGIGWAGDLYLSVDGNELGTFLGQWNFVTNNIARFDADGNKSAIGNFPSGGDLGTTSGNWIDLHWNGGFYYRVDGNAFVLISSSASDATFKDLLSDDADHLGQILALSPVRFEAKPDVPVSMPQGVRHGFLAQDLELIDPSLVEVRTIPGTDPDAEPESYYALADDAAIQLIAKLVSAVQVLNGRVEALEAAA